MIGWVAVPTFGKTARLGRSNRLYFHRIKDKEDGDKLFMGLSALEKIQEIQAKADQEIKELKQQAVSEIVRRLAEAKELIRDLEVQYTALTGKNLKGETVVDQKNGIGKRDFSSVEQLATVLATPGDKKLNRKGLSDAGYSLKSAIKVARNNPAVFGFKQNGPQGEVWLK